MKPSKALKQYFWYDSFRPGQEEIIQRTLNGEDQLVIMPTWWGKSLCYQLPAVLLPWVTIVISPLIALMKDQVDGLNTQWVQACYINSSVHPDTKRELWNRILSGEITVVYVAPESLQAVEALHKRVSISLVAVDEAHCISSRWHDFRPAYKELGIIKTLLPTVPLIALTATADDATRQDILSQLNIQHAHVSLSSFDRPNLSLAVLPAQDRFKHILSFLEIHPDDSAIIYCMGRKWTEQLATKLSKHWIRAVAYHAWLPAPKREKVQEDFLMDRAQVVCATIAFGMGIDKSNVRTVIHYNLPKSIEGFYQEIWRAWRDGLPSDTLLFYTYRDVAMLTKFAQDSWNSAVQLAKLERMKQYAESLTCRRRILMNYFGEPMTTDCGNCDVCRTPPEFTTPQEWTRIAQIALSAILRMWEREAMWRTISVLRWSRSSDIVARWYDQIKTHGAWSNISTQDRYRYLIQLVNLWACAVDFTRNERITVTDYGKRIVLEWEQCRLAKPNQSHSSLRGDDTLSQTVPVSSSTLSTLSKEEYIPLYEKLKTRRLDLSRERNIPAYVIFSDKTLLAIAQHKPSTRSELLSIQWVGQKKLEQRGNAVLQVVN